MQTISEERARYISTKIWNTLKSGSDAKFPDPNSALELIKKAFIAYVSQDKEVDLAARKKIESLKRDVPQGSPEWDILYRKYCEEEKVKRGL